MTNGSGASTPSLSWRPWHYKDYLYRLPKRRVLASLDRLNQAPVTEGFCPRLQRTGELMAELIKFPARPRSRHARRSYQVHEFAEDGGVLTSRSITARNDTDAKRLVRKLTYERRIELWSTSRFVAQFGPLDTPVATWIKSLKDRPAIDL